MTSRSQAGVSDGAMLAIVGCALAVTTLVWLWGGMAGFLFGGGWPPSGPEHVLSVLSRLPAHLSDPASAWPRPARARLPGPTGTYGALGVVLVGVVALTWLGRRATARLTATRPQRGARWAAAPELRRLRARGRRDGRLILGKIGGRRLYAEQRHAVVAFGPPQSGKSAGLAVPALLEWQGPAVASSIKTDLVGVTAARRRALGEVMVFDPFDLAGMGTHSWSPLGQARTWDGALEVAWRLAAAGELDAKSVEGGDFWTIAAEQRLAPLLYTAAKTGAGIEALVRWAYGQGSRELDAALAQMAGEAQSEEDLLSAHAAYDAIRAFEAQADRTRSSIEATAQSLLRAYRFGRVVRSARDCDIAPDRLLDSGSTLYLIGDARASKLLRPIFLALLGEIVDRAYERATLAGGWLERPLLLCLDEAGNVAPLPNLGEIASTAPSHNIQLLSIFHDLAQARTRYGRQAETVINSHRARMLLPGVADLDTLRYFAGLVGEEEAREVTRTVGAGGTTRSSGRRRRPLVAAEALRQLPEDDALLIYGRLPPTQLRLRMWFRDRRLRRLAGS